MFSASARSVQCKLRRLIQTKNLPEGFKGAVQGAAEPALPQANSKAHDKDLLLLWHKQWLDEHLWTKTRQMNRGGWSPGTGRAGRGSARA